MNNTRRTIAAAALIVASTLTAGCGVPDDEKARFREACAERGGYLAQTQTTTLGLGSWVECIKDDKIIYLEGFA